MMTPSESISFLMEKADRSLVVAKEIVSGNNPDFGVSRAYYGMFYAAEAVLLTRGLQYKKHSAVIASFNKEFVKSGVFPKDMARLLEKAFDYRMQGDYGMAPVDAEKANAVLSAAEEFVEAARAFLKREGFLAE